MTLSPRQYQMLKAFRRARYIGMRGVRMFDQRPLRSMLMRKYVTYSDTGFHITKAGMEALNTFEEQNILRKDPSRPLTSYFNTRLYHIKGAA